jgi:hypothetical protein
MASIESEHARLLESADAVELELARSLLEAAGIPSLAHGPDFDVAELGSAVHDALRRRDLYVPRSSLAEARALLERAWGHTGRGPAAG